MATNYPTTLDDGTVLESDRANTSLTVNDHATQHNNLSDAVKAIETELGTLPKGSYTDVKTRLNDGVVKTPTGAQVISPGGDYTGIAVKANVALATANLFEGRDSSNNIKFYVDKNNNVSAQGFLVNGTALAASNLSNGVTGTGAVVLASSPSVASPALTGTPTAPTPTVGDNSTKVATTAFVTTAISNVSTTAGSSGTLAARPSAASKTGLFYWATDQAVLYFSDGSAWNRMTVPAGTLVDFIPSNGAVPTGWVAYDGGTLGGTTGIYADLYAHLGSTTTLPDTRGRVTAGYASGGNVEVATLGSTDGLALASRRITHKHTRNGALGLTGSNSSLSLSGSNSSLGFSAGSYVSIIGASITTGYNFTGSATAWANGSYQNPSSGGGLTGANSSLSLSGSNSTLGFSDTMTIGPQTNSPTDGSAYIVVLKIAKL